MRPCAATCTMPASDSARRSSARVAVGLVRTRPAGQTRPASRSRRCPAPGRGGERHHSAPGRASAAGRQPRRHRWRDGHRNATTRRQSPTAAHRGDRRTTTNRDDDSSSGRQQRTGRARPARAPSDACAGAATGRREWRGRPVGPARRSSSSTADTAESRIAVAPARPDACNCGPAWTCDIAAAAAAASPGPPPRLAEGHRRRPRASRPER